MKTMLAVVVSLVAVLPVAASAQQTPPMPKPGPEHDFLKQDVGTWDATVEFMPPGAPPVVSKGTETVSMLGDFWQLARFEGEMMGQPFQGLGTTGYDPTKKKYVGTWIDSITPGLSMVEASYDPATKTLTGTMEGPDMSGNMMKMRETTQWTGADDRVFTMYGPKGSDGKEPVTMRITYKRRK